MRPIALIITFLVIIGLVVIVYFYVPNPSETGYVNVSISASYNNQKVITQLDAGGTIFNTTKYYETIKVEKGEFLVKNTNIDNQNFYEEVYKYNITNNDTRIDVQLEKPEIPKITINHINPLIISISSKDFKETKFCLISSINLIFVEANYTKIDNPEGYSNYDVCYGAFDLNNTRSFQIDYTPISAPKTSDYLNITVFDRDGNKVTKNIYR